MVDEIEKNGRVDGLSFFCVFEREVQMGAGTASTVACLGDDGAVMGQRQESLAADAYPQ